MMKCCIINKQEAMGLLMALYYLITESQKSIHRTCLLDKDI